MLHLQSIHTHTHTHSHTHMHTHTYTHTHTNTHTHTLCVFYTTIIIPWTLRFAVLGNVLKGLGPNPLKAAAGPPRVARVTVLGKDGVQQTYDGVLVGVDKSRDLAVVRVWPSQIMRAGGCRCMVACLWTPTRAGVS